MEELRRTLPSGTLFDSRLDWPGVPLAFFFSEQDLLLLDVESIKTPQMLYPTLGVHRFSVRVYGAIGVGKVT
jgi:hypothetical protein